MSATIPSWRRFPAAEEWLRKHHAIVEPQAVRAKFEQFLTARASSPAGENELPQDRETLFREFLQWNKARQRH